MPPKPTHVPRMTTDAEAFLERDLSSLDFPQKA
jgi:hypothetical protein